VDVTRRRGAGAELPRRGPERELLDEVRVIIDPLVVGGGKRLFGDGNPIRALRLVESQVTGTGAIIATYAAADLAAQKKEDNG
jgi:riboflavin biosynthesis pyrimidine reductase